MNLQDSVYIAGHRGMVGAAIVKALQENGYTNIITKTHAELDLTNQLAVNNFFETVKPQYVFVAAAKVGGIKANDTYRADFIYQNLMIEANIIHASYVNKVTKLLFLGSSCIYPKLAPQPLKEEYLLTNTLESTNEPYAIAKIAGIKMCEAYRAQYGCNFISAMPTNLYGPNDNYHPQNSHVLPALIRKFHEAKTQNLDKVIVWGSGKALREFLYVDDLAKACLYLMKNYNDKQFVNIGTGKDLSIADLALLIKKIIGYEGQIEYDTTQPDGTPRKLMDVGFINKLGWKHSIELEEGIAKVYSEVKDKL